MKIKRIKPDCWPRLAAMGGMITKDEYRALQSYAETEIGDEAAQILVNGGLCVKIEEGTDGD